MRNLFAVILTIGLSMHMGCEKERTNTKSNGCDTDRVMILKDPEIILPEIVERPAPDYPDSIHLEAPLRVIVEFFVDSSGQILSVTLSKPTGTAFDSLAIQQARLFRFKPGYYDGKISSMKILFPIVYKPRTDRQGMQ